MIYAFFYSSDNQLLYRIKGVNVFLNFAKVQAECSVTGARFDWFAQPARPNIKTQPKKALRPNLI